MSDGCYSVKIESRENILYWNLAIITELVGKPIKFAVNISTIPVFHLSSHYGLLLFVVC